MRVTSTDAQKWEAIFAREHEAVLADQDNVRKFLAALTELTRATGINLTATCCMRLDRGDLTLMENIEWSSRSYAGDIPS